MFSMSRFLLLICALLVAQSACDRPKAPATQPAPADNTAELTAKMQEIQQYVEGQTYRDENELPRLREVLETLRSRGSKPFVQEPRMMLAWYTDDEPYVVGADRIMIHAIGPRVDVERVEFLNPDHVVLGTAKNFQGGHWRKTGPASIVTTTFYIAPSTFDPSPTTRTAGIDEGKIEIMDVVKIPSSVDRSTVSARVVYKNGAVSNAISLFVDRETHYAATQPTTDQSGQK